MEKKEGGKEEKSSLYIARVGREQTRITLGCSNDKSAIATDADTVPRYAGKRGCTRDGSTIHLETDNLVPHFHKHQIGLRRGEVQDTGDLGLAKVWRV